VTQPFDKKQKEFYHRFIDKHLDELIDNYNYFVQNEVTHVMYHEPGIFLISKINPDYSPYRKIDAEDNNIMGQVFVGEYSCKDDFRQLLDKTYYTHGLEKIFVLGEKDIELEKLARSPGFTKIRAYPDPCDEYGHLNLEFSDINLTTKPC